MFDQRMMTADPFELAAFFWPDDPSQPNAVVAYDKQREIVYSVEDNDITFVKAANMVGKDWIAGLICTLGALRHPWFRIVTTSIAEDGIRILWDEIKRFIRTSSFPWDRERLGVLLAENGGPFVLKHNDLRIAPAFGHLWNVEKSYIIGIVAEKLEKMAGHHAPWNLWVADEASGVPDIYFEAAQGWAKRFLAFGNPNRCENFFFKGCELGDVPYEGIAA